VLQTDHYVRFERVSAVAEAKRGLLADVHTEQLRVDVVRADIVRVKISRGGVFDESPTFAVCVDPLVEPVEFTLVRETDRVRLITTRAAHRAYRGPGSVGIGAGRATGCR